ncbi:MAG: response regulator transcription factor [Anaerolineae bacterium]
MPGAAGAEFSVQSPSPRLAVDTTPHLSATITPHPLSEREVEILRLLSDGLSNREIAEQLFLATGTVKWYLGEIYSKLHVNSRTQAIARARDARLLN